MISSPTYCIDTSAIIDARTRRYPPDVFPKLWKKVEELITVGRLRAPEDVLIELQKKTDETYQWARSQAGLFIPLSSEQFAEAKRIMKAYPYLVHNTKDRTAADPFVIALAKLSGYTVITEEHLTSNPQKPHIPNVCSDYGVPNIRFLEVIRQEKWAF